MLSSVLPPSYAGAHHTDEASLADRAILAKITASEGAFRRTAATLQAPATQQNGFYSQCRLAFLQHKIQQHKLIHVVFPPLLKFHKQSDSLSLASVREEACLLCSRSLLALVVVLTGLLSVPRWPQRRLSFVEANFVKQQIPSRTNTWRSVAEEAHQNPKQASAVTPQGN